MTQFTIITPCRNAAGTLPATLRSLRAQSHQDWRAIIADDGSTDASAEILAAASARDPRVRLVRLQGGGASLARNAAAAHLERAAGFIAFLDADDLWPPDRLARLAARIQADQGRIDAYFGRVSFFDSDPAAPSVVTAIPTAPPTVVDLLFENPVCTLSNLVLKASWFAALGGFDADLTHGEDVDLLIRLIAAGGSVRGVDAVLTQYRASDRGLSADLDAMHDGWRRCLHTARALGAPISRRCARRAEAANRRYLARRALRLGLPPRIALRHAAYGLAASPRGFFAGGPAARRQALLTLLAVAAGPATPRAARRRLFA